MRHTWIAIASLLLGLSAGTSVAEEREEPVEKSANAAEVPIEQLTWGEFDASDEHPFKTWLHSTAPETLATSCSWQLSAAQWTQDVVAARDSEAHFDNCAFDKGAAFVADRLREADDAVRARRLGAAMFALGQALHAIQDFYSHSNYVELLVAASPNDAAGARPVPIWLASGRDALKSLQAAGLVSGTVGYSVGASKSCTPAAPSHEQIAKDSASFSDHAKTVIPGWQNRTFFVAALDLAAEATQEFLRYSFDRWPELGRACGKPIGYLTIVERRQLR